MRAAVFPAPGTCEITERQLPIPAGDQVLVRVEACGVCGTDAHVYQGEFPARYSLLAGHEFPGFKEGIALLESGKATKVMVHTQE